MAAENIVMLQHLLIALLASGLIGLERGYHGRPAGFRTHALVRFASSALIVVDVSGALFFFDGCHLRRFAMSKIRATLRRWSSERCAIGKV
jgi:uncharacterized membrane protein YhiD involved in acid resistance